jgi:hypothetical protein
VLHHFFLLSNRLRNAPRWGRRYMLASLYGCLRVVYVASFFDAIWARAAAWRTRRLAQGGVSPAEAMHQALGEFLTEMGRVEFQMLLLMDFLNEAPIEALFAETTGKPFGEKIKIFKTWNAPGLTAGRKLL